jgi:valine--pyruvate aminotransferase
MKISNFAKKIACESGIGRLMDDLGVAFAQGKDMLMLGGGNPAHIPEVQEYFRQSMRQLLKRPADFAKAIGDYSPPQGNKEFIEAITELLNKEFHWGIKCENIALTNGSQSAFFILFNMFAGRFEDGLQRKILFPLAPEYIGYCDVGLEEGLFVANKPLIDFVDDRVFKYHIDFENLNITDDIGAICVSRPTNPTGNVLTDSEIHKLSELAKRHDIPLIIDNAYGTPFPNIIFTQAAPIWSSQTIVCMSLSKLGLPSARTGIIVAAKEIIDMVAKANAVMILSPGSLGAAIATEMVRTGQILTLARDVIKPYYRKKAEFAIDLLMREFNGLDFYMHKSEGAIFLWLWFKDLPITTFELYERLKKRKVIVVPGHYFFPGLPQLWQHKDQCIRINYSRDPQTISTAISIIADEVKKACTKGH